MGPYQKFEEGFQDKCKETPKKVGEKVTNIGVSGLSELSRMIHGAEYRDNLVLYSTVLLCTLLFCTVQMCTVMYSTHCTLYSTVQCYTVQYIIVLYIKVQYCTDSSSAILL